MKTEQTNLVLRRRTYLNTMWADTGDKAYGIMEIVLFDQNRGPFLVCGSPWPKEKRRWGGNNPFDSLEFPSPAVFKRKPDWSLPAFIMLAKHEFMTILDEDKYILFLCPELLGMKRSQWVENGSYLFEGYELAAGNDRIAVFNGLIRYLEKDAQSARHEVDEALKEALDSTFDMNSLKVRGFPSRFQELLAAYDKAKKDQKEALELAEKTIAAGGFLNYDERVNYNILKIMQPLTGEKL